MAIRLNNAGLPVDAAISVVPRSTLFALATNALFLPALINFAIIALLMTGMQRSTDRLLHPEAIQRRQVRKEARQADPSWFRRHLRTLFGSGPMRLAGTHFVRAVVAIFRTPFGRVFAWILRNPWFVLIGLYAIFLPWTVAGLVLTAGSYVQLSMQANVSAKRDQKAITRRTEALMIGLAAAAVVFGETTIQELVRPGRLANASVQIVGHSKPLQGIFVAETQEGVYVGVNRRLVLTPERSWIRSPYTMSRRGRPKRLAL